MSNKVIIGAFSEDQASRLSGRSGLVKASLNGSLAQKDSFTNIYSYKDLLRLRVLAQLRNVFGVLPAELKRAGKILERKLGKDAWVNTKLWVRNRKVVFVEPESLKHREISSGQYVAEIALEVVTKSAQEDIKRLNRRGKSEYGKIVKIRQLKSSANVFAGTRIPVSAIQQFIDAGQSDDKILAEFPSLNILDVTVARKMKREAA